MKTNYTSAIERINRCNTIEDCDKMEKSLQRIWDNGLFTVSEFSRLDGALMKRKIEIEN